MRRRCSGCRETDGRDVTEGGVTWERIKTKTAAAMPSSGSLVT